VPLTVPIAADRSILQCIHVELRQGIALRQSASGWILCVDGREIEFRLPAGPASDVFRALQSEGCSLWDLTRLPEERDRKVTAWSELRKLWTYGWLVQVASCGQHDIAVLHNFGDLAFFPPEVLRSTPLQITEDAFIRRTGNSLVIESVSRGAMVECLDERLFTLAGLLSKPISLDALSRTLPLPDQVTLSVMAWLLAIGAVSPAGASVPVTGWSFSDRLMHARTRRGRHTGGYGATFPLRSTMPEPPAIRPSIGDRRIQLHGIDPDDLNRFDGEGSFNSVFERRRSVREHSDAPMTCGELSEFLYRVARVTGVAENGPYHIASRPYPSGGALHELEFYPLVNRCDGLPPGLYRYDGASHTLELVTGPAPATRQLLREARESCLMRGEPHVLMLLAARFARVHWKYESIAYALTLKNVGVAYQTMYLVATAMSLGPCALGGGNADGFARATGLDYWEESLVGEFMLGRPADLSRDTMTKR
jgi:oxazoline/thiazoline dehydrogenase